MGQLDRFLVVLAVMYKPAKLLFPLQHLVLGQALESRKDLRDSKTILRTQGKDAFPRKDLTSPKTIPMDLEMLSFD